MSWKTRSLLVGLLLSARPPQAVAQPQPASEDSALDTDPCLTDVLCRARFNRGRKLSKEDKYEEAVAAYESAYQRRPVAWLLINIGRTLHKLGRPQAAVTYYEQYLNEEPSGPQERKQRAELFLKEAREELAVQAAAKKPAVLPPLIVPEVTVEQEPEPAEEHPVSGLPSPVVEPPTPPVEPPRPLTPVVSAKRTPAWLWGGILSGSAVLIGGAGTGGAALAAANTARGTVYVGDPSADAVDTQQRARSLALATDVLLAVGVATVASVTTAYLIRHAVTRQPAVLPAVGAGNLAVSVGCMGSF